MKKVILAILDGVGVSEKDLGNAVKEANTPVLDFLKNNYPNSYLEASGEYVGLPKGQMGNSEVGHITIGSGRIVNQPLTIINKSIEDRTFFFNKEFLDVINHVKNNNSSLHILGLLSDGGVHSHINHIFALIRLAKANDINKLYLHVFLDGRDTLPNMAEVYLDKLTSFMEQEHLGKLATISGRYYAMDREGMWDKTKQAYDVIVNNFGKVEEDYHKLLNDSYKNAIFDEFITPTIVSKAGVIEENDGMILANFRPDRIPQLFSAITNPLFDKFETKKFNNIKLVTMFPTDNSVVGTSAFKHENIENTLGEFLSMFNYRVLRIAEYSKYPHVTHFFDGDKDIQLPGTVKIKVPRKDVETYDLEPKMSAIEVTDKIINEIDNFDFILVNYANGDMVGHTGNFDAAIKAMECLDECIRRLYEISLQKGFTLVITADHGNLEEMFDEEGNILTNHTTNKVNFIVCDKGYSIASGSLKDVAPSVLNLLNLPLPLEMTGKNLIKYVEEL